jgi:hypothetical protein
MCRMPQWKVRSPTTGWHTHNCDQVLIVTSGSGMVATEHERREINIGDVVHIKAGERHWHGAKADTTMGHITITGASSPVFRGRNGAGWGEHSRRRSRRRLGPAGTVQAPSPAQRSMRCD